MNSTSIIPTASATMTRFWDSLAGQIIQNANVPLFVRQRGGNGRGGIIVHKSGRELLIVDNAPANFFFSAAVHGFQFGLAQLITMLASGQLPVAMMLTRPERQAARYRGVQRAQMTPPNLNTEGFRVNHRVAIGLNVPLRSVSALPISDVERHTQLFLSVSNMFLSPK